MKLIALWVIGPPGSGKSTLVARSDLPDFRVVDQDAELERMLVAKGWPLDIRSYSSDQLAAFMTLRRDIADVVWSHVPIWRAEGVPIAFQTPGDKPHLLRHEVEAGRIANYTNLGVGLVCPLPSCLRRNRERLRVLPDAAVEEQWQEFQRNIAARVYEEIFGTASFTAVTDAARFNLVEWMERNAV